MQSEPFTYFTFQPIVFYYLLMVLLFGVKLLENMVFVGRMLLPSSGYVLAFPQHDSSNLIFFCLIREVHSPVPESCFSKSVQPLQSSLGEITGQIVHLAFSHILAVVNLPDTPAFPQILKHFINNCRFVFSILESSLKRIQIELALFLLDFFLLLLLFFHFFLFFNLFLLLFLLFLLLTGFLTLLFTFLLFFSLGGVLGLLWDHCGIYLPWLLAQEHFTNATNKWFQISNVSIPTGQVNKLFSKLSGRQQSESFLQVTTEDDICQGKRISNYQGSILQLFIQDLEYPLQLLIGIVILLLVNRQLPKNFPIYFLQNRIQLNIKVLKPRIHIDFFLESGSQQLSPCSQMHRYGIRLINDQLFINQNQRRVFIRNLLKWYFSVQES